MLLPLDIGRGYGSWAGSSLTGPAQSQTSLSWPGTESASVNSEFHLLQDAQPDELSVQEHVFFSLLVTEFAG